MNDIRKNMNRRLIDGEALQARFALRVASCLSEQSALAVHDVEERLRVARERALDRARAGRAAAMAPAAGQVVVADGGGAAAVLGGGPDDASAWWMRFGIVLPLLALLAGLMLIQHEHTRQRLTAVAAVDAELLVDVLPPKAYSDPGFVEYLKTANRD